MMISVLIPTYNYKCYALVHSLQQLLEQSGAVYEIIVADDGGKDQVAAIANHLINELSNCRFIRRKDNVGRAAIRNYLATQAKGDWLLFMDSDGKVISNDFITRYIESAKSNNLVVCGGIKNPDKCPSREQSLRWKYEKSYEQTHGYISDCFRSFSFFIPKDVFMDVKFDERYRRYGWEDVRFGIDLRNKGYSIKAINNPLMNTDIETNKAFLAKTEESLQSLSRFADELKDDVRLLQVISKLRSMRIIWMVKLSYFITRRLLIHNLLGGNPNIKCFNFYKIGYYLSLK